MSDLLKEVPRLLDRAGDVDATLRDTVFYSNKATTYLLTEILLELRKIRRHLTPEAEGSAAEPEGRQPEWQRILTNDSSQLIAAIKALREETGLDLAQAKSKVEEFVRDNC